MSLPHTFPKKGFSLSVLNVYAISVVFVPRKPPVIFELNKRAMETVTVCDSPYLVDRMIQRGEIELRFVIDPFAYPEPWLCWTV